MIRRVKQKAFNLVSRSVGTCDINESIIVFGSPRSGTTWLAEMLKGLPGYKLLNEPLRLSTNPRARDAGFEWRTHLPPGTDSPVREEHLRGVLQGHVDLGPAWHFRSDGLFGKLWEHVSCNSAVVKFCRLGRMLHWVAERFDVRGMVVVIRHPCAVISSRLQMGENWKGKDEEKKQIPVSCRYGGKIPERICDEFSHIFEGVEHWVEHLAISWALDYYFAFYDHPRGSEDYPWILTSYEQLLLDGEEELERIVSKLGGEVTDTMLSQIGTASSFASDSFRMDVRHQLTKWKSKLTDRQVRDILEVAEAFQLDFYEEDPAPNRDRLLQFQESAVPPLL